jgi:cytochrome c oxidase cbb3-type subunit 3
MKRQPDMVEHEVDGIRELDNDLPRWWLYGFYFTIVFAVVYVVNYHVLPTPFFGAASLVAEYEADMAAHPKAAAVLASVGGGGSAGTTWTILTDAHELEEGKKTYDSSTHPCHACHRADLGGLVGPNLTDDQWLHGCSVGEVMQSIRTGYPQLGMLPFGGGPALGDDQLLELASYILSKRGSGPPAPKPADPSRDQACAKPGA